MEKSAQPELMDTVPLAPAELRETLACLARLNRFCGGTRVILGRLKRWSARWPAGALVTLLDVGTGGADIPVALVLWARARGFRLRVTAIDPVADIAAAARENTRAFPEIEVLQAGLSGLAGRKGFDYVVGSLLLHHIPEAQLAPSLRSMDALARRGLILSDLQRGPAPYAAVRLATAFFGNRVARHDGPLSVRRAFTALELSELARRAGLPYLRCRRHAFFRLSLAGEKDHV